MMRLRFPAGRPVLSRFRPILPAAVFASLLLTAGAAAAGDAGRGAGAYQRLCSACHSVDADRVGPHHRGVVGRVAGSVAGFAYSPALAAAGFRWTPDRLDRWLADPQTEVPGQRMGFRVTDPSTRADLIAYLQSLSTPALAAPAP